MHDELDDFSKKLFAAARAERAAPEVRERVLDASVVAARETPSRALRIAGFAALAAGVAGALWFGGRGAITTTIDREPIVVAPSAAERSSGDDPPPSPAAVVPPSSVVTASAPRARVLPGARPPASLAEELALLENARAALAAGSSADALALLDRYDDALHGTKLRAEATILRIQVLAASGRSSEASRMAETFLKDNPGSPLVDRARSFVAQPGVDPQAERPAP
jgi:hypothetical protein